MTDELPTRYDPSGIEADIYRRWSEAGYFHLSAEEVESGKREPYVIMIPPPNVTAVLHMGHGLNNTIQDVLIRWRRMQGRATLWAPGTDHAGIATQNVVERQLLEEEGKARQDLGREAFERRVREFADETRGNILEQLEVIGCSADWSRTYFTLDEGLSRAVREVFVRLFEKGLVYRGEYIINWCPRCLTALSNEEAEAEEKSGRLFHLRYPFVEDSWGSAETAAEAGAEAIGQLEDGRWYLTVSTTRPETLLGDTAVAVNPDDERYAALVGARVELPFTGRTIPVIADEHVDPEFGSGMVKVTPAHDPNDFEIGQRADLDVIDVMSDTGEMNENAPERFRGMDRFDARKALVEAFDQEGLLVGIDDHVHAIPHCYRCHTVVEPKLSEQWFVSMKPLAKPALQASYDGTVTFTPERWKKVYEHWMENIRDWCISRQLWWGHRIPVWYCECGETIVAREDPTECPECGSAEIVQDPDVLDTWFSSWLVPFSAFGWPEETADLRAFYPGHTLTTAPEILFFWVARMIMAGYEFMGEPPFTEVYLHATVRDMQNRKMSKSLGNGIDPLEVVELFGADALRFTILSKAAVGTDIQLDHEDLEASFSPGRNFANKLWNAGRFALMSLGDGAVQPVEAVADDLEIEDRWILSRLNETGRVMTRELERFRLHEVSDRIYHFVWGDFADWYLELIKPRIHGDAGPESREAARSTLVAALDGICRLLHPLMPFLTTTLWDRLPWPEGVERAEELIVAAWPEADPARKDEAAEAAMAELQELITQIRSLRKEYNVGEGAEVPVWLADVGETLAGVLDSRAGAAERLARVEAFHTGERPDAVGASGVLRSGAEIFIPLEGLIDLERERERLADEVERLQGQLESAQGKLRNENFVTRAPADVVEKERDKAASYEEQIDKLGEKLAALRGS